MPNKIKCLTVVVLLLSTTICIPAQAGKYQLNCPDGVAQNETFRTELAKNIAIITNHDSRVTIEYTGDNRIFIKYPDEEPTFKEDIIDFITTVGLGTILGTF
ncbi:MAG: hypothetical protein METHP_01100 [Methanoregula sp. SKADARSKE-2]|nr:MAG: hypothetical protein METHP_01100 [Methanoregula sp. SKADARSKE-2]